MVTKVHAEQTALHNRYAALRASIIDYYRTLPLVGREAGPKAYKLPPKLGHWGPQHSERVLDACPELRGVVQRIEALIAQRSPDAIFAKYGPQKRGGWRRRGRLNNQQTFELMGEWPPRK